MARATHGITVEIAFLNGPIIDISFSNTTNVDFFIPNITIARISFTYIYIVDIFIKDVFIIDVSSIDVSSIDVFIIDISISNIDIVDISIGNTSIVDAFFTNTAIVDSSSPNTSIMPPVRLNKTPARQLAYPYPSVGPNASGKATTNRPKMKHQSTSIPGCSHAQGSSAGGSKPKETPKMLVCVNCKKKYNPDTVQFGSCRIHKDKYGRAYPDQVSMDHWRNSVTDDQGKDMWLCCGNEDKNHPGCMEWVHCQK
ncbi:hypothetical protein DL767_005729 [Monosporascus sp. MG133]|nr:hypothetical protein DL767_005729 [Monosporascus sp. MG133]